MTNETSMVVAAGLDLLMIALTHHVLRWAGVPQRVARALALALVAWLLCLGWLFSPGGPLPPVIPGWLFLVVVFAFVGIVGALLWSIPATRRAIAALTERDLAWLQGVRIFFGAAFLMHAATGNLPRLFGIIDGFTHITAGALGMTAALTSALQRPGAARSLWLANIFGLGDILIVASTLAFVLLPQITLQHSMMLAVFLPAPFWFWFHIVSIAKALRGKSDVGVGESAVGDPRNRVGG